jgi:hypothetical protein
MQFDLAVVARVPRSALGRCEPPAPPVRPPGSFYHRLRVMLRCEELYRKHLRFGCSTQSPALQPILKKIAKARARGLPEWRIAELSRQADSIGRHERVRILKPTVPLPDIDKQVAKEFGISTRTVRRYRSDPRLDPFRSVPPWEVRQWQIDEAEQIRLKRRALALVTPERFAKGDIYLFGSTLMARGVEPDLVAGAAPRPRVGCEEFRIWLHRPSNELWDIPRVKFIPARKWVHLWPGAVAGWAGNSPTWVPDLGLLGDPGFPAWLTPDGIRGGDPRLPVIAAKPQLSTSMWVIPLIVYGNVIRVPFNITYCETFAHALPDTIVMYPHSTWPWMKVAKPLWTPAAVNYVEDRLVQVIDRFFEAFIRDRLNEAKWVA